MRENEAVSCLSGGLQEGAEIEKSAFYPMRPTEVVQQVKFKATIVCGNSRKTSVFAAVLLQLQLSNHQQFYWVQKVPFRATSKMTRVSESDRAQLTLLSF